jgi:putative ABC transport system permease protein
MNFVFSMALREVRSSWQRLLFFFGCIAIGICAIVAIRSVIRNFNEVLTSDARGVLGADIEIQSNRPWDQRMIAKMAPMLQRAQAKTETIEAATMLRPADPQKQGAIMVELKGVEAGYPLYGKMELEGSAPYQPAMLINHGAIVGRPAMERLNLRVGDAVKIGTSIFYVRGILAHEPGPIGGIRFGPRIIVDRSAVESAGLTGFGSRARRKILLKAQEEKVAPLVQQLRESVKGTLLRIRSYKESEENINQQFTRAENFLSLTGLIILVLGGIGISSVTRVFLDQKKKSIAVLKCIGATGRKIILAYLLQILALGLLGSLAGIGLAKIALFIVHSRYSATLPSTMSYSLKSFAMIQGLLFGVLVTFLFSALPLLRIRNIKPNVLLREESTPASPTWAMALRGRLRRQARPRPKLVQFDWMRWSVAIAVTLGLVFLSAWQAGSLKVGVFFLGGLLATTAILQIAALLLMRSLRAMKRFSKFSVRHAISGLYRPGNQTRVILLAVGLGSFFIIAIHSLQSNLLREMDFSRRANMANMYLIDIQSDQRSGVERITKEATGQTVQLVPTVRARIVAINGKSLDPENEEYKKDRQRLGFEYTVTYRNYLEPTESIIDGRFWGAHASGGLSEISIEESLKGMMGLKVGGNITWDILGQRVTSRVSSIRRVDWHNARTGFYVIFKPGLLENAPNVYIAALNAPTAEPARSQFQRKLIDAYPNVTAIDVNDIVATVSRILNNVTLAVSFLGGFVFLAGLLILLGSIALTKFQRIYESAILKTLGARRSTILFILMIEYCLLGVLAGLIGTLAGIGLSYLVGRYVLEVPFHHTPEIYLAGIFLTALLVVLIGALSSVDVLNRKPLSILRAE